MNYTITKRHNDGSPFFKETTKHFHSDAECARYCNSISSSDTSYYGTPIKKEETIKGDIAGGQNASYF